MAEPSANTVEIDDTSSSYGDSIGASDTTSLSSSIEDYVYENGRRYHRYQEGQYTMPNDETEQDRLDLTHHLALLLSGGSLYTAPLGTDIHNVLDAGTGTGIWALDFGETHPSAKVIGVDLSPIQPRWVFPNVQFEVDDLEQDWTWPKDYFDYIHSRTMGNAIKDFQRYVSHMFKHTKPGGYVELVEYGLDKLYSDDNTYNEDIALYKYFQNFGKALTAAGMNAIGLEDLLQHLKTAGFVDIQVTTRKQPWGSWPKNKQLKRAGQICAMVAETGIEAYALALFTRQLGMSEDEAKKMCSAALADVQNRSIHAYNYCWSVVGKKPENGGS